MHALNGRSGRNLSTRSSCSSPRFVFLERYFELLASFTLQLHRETRSSARSGISFAFSGALMLMPAFGQSGHLRRQAKVGFVPSRRTSGGASQRGSDTLDCDDVRQDT